MRHAPCAMRHALKFRLFHHSQLSEYPNDEGRLLGSILEVDCGENPPIAASVIYSGQREFFGFNSIERHPANRRSFPMCSLRSILIAIIGLSASASCLAMLTWPCQAPGQAAEAPPSSQPPSKKPVDTAKIERLVRQLGSERFAEREAASKALDDIGEPALLALRKVRESTDLEVRRRVAVLLKSIEQKRMGVRAKGAAVIERFGGYFATEDGGPDSPTRWVNFFGFTGAGDAAAAWLPYFDDALSLSLQDIQISDDGLANVETFYRVEDMVIYRNKTMTDAGLKHIGKLVTLRKLQFSETRLTGSGLIHLKNLRELVWLHLSDSPITDERLKHLKPFKKLEWLNLRGTQITDRGIDYVREIETLQKLDLSRTHITDAGLAKLKNLKKLWCLTLTGTPITDAGLDHLKEIPMLKVLHLDGTKVTDRGKEALRESLPKLVIREPIPPPPPRRRAPKARK
jgi:hypothetical protein